MSDGTQPPATPPSPATAQEARAALDAKLADQDWGARLTAGDAEVAREWNSLQAKAADPADDVARAMAGVEQDGPLQDSDHVFLVNMANFFRSLGMREEVVKECLERREILPQARDWVVNAKADRMADSEWVKKFFSGDREVGRWMTTAHDVLSRPVKGERYGSGF